MLKNNYPVTSAYQQLRAAITEPPFDLESVRQSPAVPGSGGHTGDL